MMLASHCTKRLSKITKGIKKKGNTKEEKQIKRGEHM
jgi:hypothetical protein